MRIELSSQPAADWVTEEFLVTTAAVLHRARLRPTPKRIHVGLINVTTCDSILGAQMFEQCRGGVWWNARERDVSDDLDRCACEDVRP